MASMNKILRTKKNCLVIDVVDAFPGDMVPTQEWFNFLTECMKLEFREILSAFIYQKTNLLMVTVNSEEVFENALQSLEQGVLWTKYKKKVYGWSATTVTTPVTVVNIPYGLDLNLINNLLSKWGTITKGTLGYHKESGYIVADGTYHLKMILKENTVLPSVIDVPSIGEKFLVFSTASKKVCLKCTRQGHIARYCRFQERTPAASNPSWARIVEEGVSVKNPNPPPTTNPTPVSIEPAESQEMNPTPEIPEKTGGAPPAPPTTSSLENATPPRPLPLSTPPPPANETQEDTSDETPETSNPQKEVEPEGNNPPSPPRPNSKPGEESENEEKGSDGEGWVTKKLRSGKKRIEHRTINKDKILKDLSVKKSNVVKKLI